MTTTLKVLSSDKSGLTVAVFGETKTISWPTALQAALGEGDTAEIYADLIQSACDVCSDQATAVAHRGTVAHARMIADQKASESARIAKVWADAKRVEIDTCVEGIHVTTDGPVLSKIFDTDAEAREWVSRNAPAAKISEYDAVGQAAVKRINARNAK